MEARYQGPFNPKMMGGLLLVFAETNRRCAQAETKKLYTLLNQAIVNLSVTIRVPDSFHK